MTSQPFEHLLLATECSDQDSGAEAIAFEMARHCGLPLRVLLPLHSNPEYEAMAPQLALRAEAEAARRLQGLREQAANAGVAIELQVRRGPELYEEIVAEARERGADLIVVRRRGRRGLMANLLLGEMVRNVVSHAPCSVLVAPRGARMWGRRVLVAFDPASQDLGPVGTAADMALRCGLPLSIVCVAPEAGAQPAAERALQRARATAAAIGAAVDGQVRVGRPHEQIVVAARELAADLLVIGRRTDEGLARAWLGGAAQKVIGLAEVPVLVAVKPSTTSGARR
jgi:nucleotide-binding universal stress UspA family protein